MGGDVNACYTSNKALNRNDLGPFCVQLVEAGGIEPPSRDISAKVSTCVVHLLAFLGPRGSGGQDPLRARVGLIFPLGPARHRTSGSLLWSPIPASQARRDGRRGQLSRECVVRFGT